MKTKTIVGAVAVCAVLSLYGANGLAGVKSVGDSVCSVSDSVVMSNGIAIVDYVLKPEAASHIRCRIALPPPEEWNGEFWGIGNSSFGGVFMTDTSFSDNYGSWRIHPFVSSFT